MEFIAFLLLIAFLVLVVGSVMGFIANSRISTLERKLDQLNRKVSSLQAGEPVTRTQAAPVTAAAPAPAVKKAPEAQSKPQPRTTDTPDKPAESKPQPAQLAAARKAKPARPPKPKKPKRSFEEEIGAKWTVWVGGLALLLGAVFLLRYSIEAGFFTPSMRIAMASLLGAALLGGSEWLRRSDKKPSAASAKTQALMDNSYIPGMLAGVGIFTLLATVFAAFQLYGFIGPMTAFGLMALISIGALLLGLVHGPWISALGLVASFATPLLIKTDDPSVLGVFGYLSIISLVSWALARFRKWGWLDLATLAGGLFWLHFAHRGMAELGNLLPWYGFMGLGFIASTLIASKPKPATFKLGELPLVHSPITATIWAAIAGAILLQTINLMGYDFATEAVLVLTFVAAMVVSVIYSPRLIGHLAVGAAVAFGYFVATGYNVPNGQTGLSLALALAAIIGGAFFWILNGKKIPAVKAGNFNVWPYIGAFSPIMILIGAHVEVADINITWMAASFLGLAVLLLAASMMLRRSRDDQAGMFSPYPWAAALSYVLGLVIWQDGMGVSLGLIAGIAVFAALHMRLKWESLRWISLGFAGLAAIHIILDRLPDGSAISATPFMNELWIYLALPSLICFIAGFALTRSERDLPAEGLKAAGLVFLTLFAVFQVRHGMNDGVITSGSFSFAEIALQVLTGLCFTLGGVFLNVGEVQKTETIKTKGKKTGLAQSSLDILPALMTGISYLTLAGFVLLLCFAVAPLFNRNFEVGGGPVFNDLILAYALPVILMLAILWKGQDRRPKHYLRLLAGLSLVGILMYVTSQIRRVFTGTGISIFDTFPDGLETYVISASWLLIGIGMLVAGLKLGSKSIRLGSGVVIILTVLKAFMIDMATLEGVLRAVSFVILGLVLIVIGRVYQKILFSDEAEATNPA